MYSQIKAHLEKELQEIEKAGLFKRERIIHSPQGVEIELEDGSRVLNFCANNYLGLSNNPEVIQAAKDAMDERGFGMSSVRFICGTQDLHKQLEAAISEYYCTEDTILYAAAFDANGGLFEPLLTAQDGIVSDSLNHASIIDGVRLCKARRYRYANNDMGDLENRLKAAREDGCRFLIIVTDGVFSMDGLVAPMDHICELAEKYEAMVMVDECHATGFIGNSGIGTPEEKGVLDRVDIITGTLGKSLGGAMGGYTTGKKEIIELLRQRSRPYLFSNALPPAILGGSLKVFEILKNSPELPAKVKDNTAYFMAKMREAGFDLIGGEAAIVAVMVYDAALSQRMADELLKRGIYVIGFFYPVVPKEKARIRVQLSAAHSREQIDQAVSAFVEVGKSIGLI